MYIYSSTQWTKLILLLSGYNTVFLLWLKVKEKEKSLSGVRLFATPWTIQSMEFSRPEYWSGQPFPAPGDLPDPGIKPRSPALQVGSSPAEPQGKLKNTGVHGLSLLQGIFPTQESNQVSCIAGRFFTNLYWITERLRAMLAACLFFPSSWSKLLHQND